VWALNCQWSNEPATVRVVKHRRFDRLISPEKLLTLEGKFNRRGALVIFIGRHLIEEL